MQNHDANVGAGARTWDAQLRAIADTAAALRQVDAHVAARQGIDAERHEIVRAWGRTQACQTELIAERDDAALALAQEHAEQELGVPCLALGALQAHMNACQAAVEVLEAELERLDACYDLLTNGIRRYGTPEGQ